jgi:Htaa
MRSVLRTVVAAGALTATMLAGGLAGAGTAAAAPDTATPLRSGTTTVTTGPGIATTLLRNGILPLATPPGRQGFGYGRGGLTTSFSFPVTGGAVDLATLAGTITHRGGITFVNLRSGKRLAVSDFVIDTRTGTLTARVNRTSTRIAVFTLDLSAATVDAAGTTVKVGNIDVRLTAGAADALNQALGTHVFADGLDLGTARTTLRV